MYFNETVDWDNIIGIATCYGLDDSGFEPQKGQEIVSSPYPSIQADPEAHLASSVTG